MLSILHLKKLYNGGTLNIGIFLNQFWYIYKKNYISVWQQKTILQLALKPVSSQSLSLSYLIIRRLLCGCMLRPLSRSTCIRRLYRSAVSNVANRPSRIFELVGLWLPLPGGAESGHTGIDWPRHSSVSSPHSPNTAVVAAAAAAAVGAGQLTGATSVSGICWTSLLVWCSSFFARSMSWNDILYIYKISCR